jgi:Tfp pilus assembly protein PilZ
MPRGPSHARTDGATPSRVLRLRGDRSLEKRLLPAEAGEAGRLELDVRDPLIVGDGVRVEISFGPLADEVELDGTVVRVSKRQGASTPAVILAFGRDQGPQLRYLRHVLAGRRSASARRHRRVPVDFEVRWRRGRTHYASRLSDLSRGGAFIVSRALPRIGEEVAVEILADEPGVLQIDAVVSWVRQEGTTPGFGVNFKLTDRGAAAALGDIVRRRER